MMDSMHRFELLKISDERWLNFISARPDSVIFHHPSWIKMIAQYYRFTPFLAIVTNPHGQILAGVPIMAIKKAKRSNRWVSLPFTDHCAPLAETQEDLLQLENGLVESMGERKAADLELRWEYPDSQKLFHSNDYMLAILDISGELKDIAHRMGSNNYRKTRLAGKHGVTVENGTSMKYLEMYYQLHLETRRRQGVPVQPWGFFKALQKEILEPGMGNIWLGMKEGKAVAGLFTLNWNKTFIYKYSANNEIGRQTFASYSVLWEAIQWANSQGYTRLDFGRSDISNEGLRRYKNQWGSTEIPLIYTSSKQSTSPGMIHTLTPFISRIINISPLWVCRLSGELFYRYFG
jgi:hypothetical protein